LAINCEQAPQFDPADRREINTLATPIGGAKPRNLGPPDRVVLRLRNSISDKNAKSKLQEVEFPLRWSMMELAEVRCLDKKL
jgi:hypothetical protein